ncbi:MAG: SUMF1/EgtB/PvdO family nonheme iron enzyme [Gammaproteobacteria bacterium]|nr:SUMF1/EgtB/PvdO family nonheme iron enzyme [Gammaproteobacteria bacterium]
MSDPQSIAAQLRDAHQRTMALIAGLDREQMMGPMLATVNPLLWEIGHAAYFYEYWVLRQHLGHAPLRADVDALYDSISIAHDDRWSLPLPGLQTTLDYIEAVEDAVVKALANGDDARRDYLAQYAVFHHDMHNEAYTYTRQTLHYPAPDFGQPPTPVQSHEGDSATGQDAHIPGGSFMLGARHDQGFVFDNEKWAHPVEIAPFSIARTAVSNAQFLAFVEDDGYARREFWDDAGWQWLQARDVKHPRYWRHADGNWQQRSFDRWHPLTVSAAVIHVCWHEAQAWCRWAGRRLPSEAEWEVAASAEPSADGRSLSAGKRLYPWGDSAPGPQQVNMDGHALGTVDVDAHAAGDSAFGCRQMLGNTWEWTEDTFGPFPGFTPDMYQDYSQPLFGITKVLRGGAWATRSRMIRNTWRTYYGPDRNDVFAGFRTCAL